MSFEYFIGGRYLRAKQKQAFISLITLLSIAGVTVGVMALIVVIAVMAGFEADLKERILGVESHVVLMRHGGGFNNYSQVLDSVKTLKSVEAATPFILGQVMLRSKSGVSGAVLRGIDPDTVGQVVQKLDASTLKKQDMINNESKTAIPGIVLGKELANNLNVAVNDVVYIISPRGMISPMGHMPSMKRFRIKALFESGMYEYDGSLAFIHLLDAQRLMRMDGGVSGIEIRVKDIHKAADVSKKIRKKLGFPYWTRDWMQMNRNLFSALKLEKTVMFIILALIVLVAAFNIASSLIMMVMQKTRDIAILKAMGASDRSIRKIFIFKGMVVGAVGTFLGVCSGFILCELLERYKFIELPGDVYYITTLPVQLQGLDVFLIALSALVICFLATLYPSRQASALNPVEAIRFG